MAQKESKNTQLAISTNYMINTPRDADCILVRKIDWADLHNRIESMTFSINWWEYLMTFSFTHALTMLVTALLNTQQQLPKPLEVSAYFALGIGITSLVFMLTQKKLASETKENILKYMKSIEDQYLDAEETIATNIVTTDWNTSKTTKVQGASMKQIPLNQGSLKKISFCINTNNEYWRVGVRFSETSEVASRENLLCDNSSLIHIHRTNGAIGIVQYLGSDSKPVISHSIQSDLNKILFTIEKNGEGVSKLKVGENYSEQINIPENYFRYATICTWADDNDYDIIIENISYLAD